jgi:hypothetical protein
MVGSADCASLQQQYHTANGGGTLSRDCTNLHKRVSSPLYNWAFVSENASDRESAPCNGFS